MEITILKNDAFRVLMESTGMTSMELEKRIIDAMVNHDLIDDSNLFETYGLSVWEILDESLCDTDWVKEVIFNDIETNDEIFELLKSIIFWGMGTEHPCGECGSEMTSERDGCDGKYWNEWTCENPCCDNTESDEPDHDTMQGGHDWDD